MTQGEKVRGGDREAIRALDAVIFEKIEGVPWLAKHILAAIREGRVPGIGSVSTPTTPAKEEQWEIDLLRKANDDLHKEVAELRGKVGEVEKGVALIRTKTIGELHIPEADAILDEIAEICDSLLRKSP